LGQIRCVAAPSYGANAGNAAAQGAAATPDNVAAPSYGANAGNAAAQGAAATII